MKIPISMKRIMSLGMASVFMFMMLITTFQSTAQADWRHGQGASHRIEESYEIVVGETVSIDVEGDKVKFKSSDSKIAKVSRHGLVTGKKEGTAIITAVVTNYAHTTPPRFFWQRFFYRFFFSHKTVKTTAYEIKVISGGNEESAGMESSSNEEPSRGEETSGEERPTLPEIGETSESTGVPEPSTEESMTEESSSVSESTSSDRPVEPENPSEIEAYYWESSKEVISVYPVSDSTEIKTESDVAQTFKNLGFVDYPIYYDFTMNGDACFDSEVEENSSEKHPMYYMYYVTDRGETWTIYMIDGTIIAYPVSYMAQCESGVEVLISESESLVSYDEDTNQFLKTIPKESAAIIITVDRIDAQSLNRLTVEEIKKYEN